MNPKLLLPLLLLLFFSCENHDNLLEKIDLTDNWEFQMNKKWFPAKVPGTIHTDLLKNKLIPDPFWENNEDSLQWIENRNWTYQQSFLVSDKLLAKQHIDIVFEGLDTYAEVWLNQQKIIAANNMFRSWRKDIKPFLKAGENTLEVHFKSPILENKEKVANYPYQLPSGNEIVDIKVSAFTRKAAYQFGWDWGPRFVGCGIWKPVHLEAWSEGRIKSTYAHTTQLTTDKAEIAIEVEVDLATAKKYTLKVNNQAKEYDLEEGSHVLHFTYTINQPKLWWPNGLGAAHLYDLDIILLQNKQILDTHQQQLGLRTIELIHEKDNTGTSFYFKINGENVFMKGANIIPQDIFTGNFTTQRYEALIQKVKSSNMNMLRVWGGGIYENDVFFDLCDKNGILVWQDFMFAGSLYPDDDAFLENIKQEVRENIIRLRNHPSLALWCGNNEIEVAWNNWGWQKQYGYTPTDSIIIWDNYLNIFEKIIPEQIAMLDNNRAYVPTSPLSNWGSPENFNHSSMHYWGVWHGREPIENYKTNIGRFMVEYGFQSFPSMDLIKSFAADSSLHLASETMKNRQKSYIGNGLLATHIKRWYGKANSFEDFVNKNQKFQTEALKMAIKSHRRHKPHCMGTLFWQLNDCWTGPSWSVLDYSGAEKPAMNMVLEYYKPVIAVAEEVGGSLAIFIVSDLLHETEATLTLQLKTKNGKPIWDVNKKYKIKKNSVILALQKPFEMILKGHSKQEVLLDVNLKTKDGSTFNDTIRFVPEK